MINKIPRSVKYIISGASGGVINLSIYAVLIYQFKIWYIAAAVIAYCTGALISFCAQKFWTFNHKNINNIHRELLSYFVIGILNIFLNGYLLFLFVQEIHFDKFLANVLSNGMVAAWSFFIYKHFTFKSAKNIENYDHYPKI